MKKKKLEYISDFVFKFFVKDPSNENIYFKRVKIRKIMRDFEKSGLDKDKLFLTLKNLKISNNAIEYYVDQNKRLNSFLDKKNKRLILNKIFFNQPHEIVFRSLADYLKIIGGNYFFPRGKKVDNVLQKIEKGTLKKETLSGCVIKKVNHSIIITKEC